MLRINNEVSADNTTLDSTTSTVANRETDELPEPRSQSSSCTVLTDGASGSHSSETCESSTEFSVYDLGKPTDSNFLVEQPGLLSGHV